MSSMLERAIHAGKTRFFRGAAPHGGHEGSSQIEGWQAVLPYIYEPGDWFLGRVHARDLIATGGKSFRLGHKSNQHLWLIGSTRAFKGAGQIVYNVAKHPGNTVLIDPKAEGYRLLAEPLKAKGTRVVLLDPFRYAAERLGLPSTGDECGYNMMFDINPWSRHASRKIAELASILVEKPSGGESSGGQYWNKMTRNVIAGLLAFASVYVTPEAAALRDAKAAAGKALTYGDQQRVCLLQNIMMAANFALWSAERRMTVITRMRNFEQTIHALARQAGIRPLIPPISRLIRTGGSDALTLLGPRADPEGMRTLLNMLSSTFMWIDSSTMISDLAGLDFEFRMSQLKSEDNLAVFVVIPDSAFESHGAYLRILITSIINACAGEDWADGVNPRRYPINLILDECPQYGHIPALERLLSIGAGQGIRAVIVSQNKTQLDAIYGEAVTEAFIANSAQVLLSGGDNTTGEYFAKKAGKTYSKDQKTGEQGEDKVPVLELDEFWKMIHPDRKTLLYSEGGRGLMRVRLCPYYDEPDMQPGVDFVQHPDHASFGDQMLKRGVAPVMASRPRGYARPQEGDEPEHIMISDGSERLPARRTGV